MTNHSYKLDGKTALITGAAGLLGYHHASALIEEGARVVLTDISVNRLKETEEKLCQKYRSAKIVTSSLDVTSEASIESLADKLTKQNIRVDILINNAAIDPKVSGNALENTSRLETLALDDWNFQISVGLTGAFLCSRVFGHRMSKDGKGGVIINISSDLSVIAPDQRLYSSSKIEKQLRPVKPVTYSVIKTGLIGLTKYLATYWVDEGVRCNALSPGGVYNGQKREFVEKVEKLIPLGRMANVDEYKGSIKFLASDSSSYLNGHNLIVDGGRSAW